MLQPKAYEDVVFGSGAGGKLLAWHLAELAPHGNPARSCAEVGYALEPEYAYPSTPRL